MGANVKVSSSVTKISGLVNEYVTKLEVAMQGKGALEVDKIEGKSGNFVFINGHAVGLSSRLSDFEELAVRMTTYEKTLASLTASTSFGKKAGQAINVKP